MTVLDLIPKMAFMDSIDVEVWVRAEPIYNLTTIACCLHVVQVPGRYVTDQNGVEYIACTIPSIQFLIVESIDLGAPLPESKEFAIEVSMNEETFSDDEF